MVGGVVSVWSNLMGVSSAISAWSQGVIDTLPEGMRPKSSVGGVAYVESTSGTGIVPISVESNGSVRVLTRGVTLSSKWMISFGICFLAA